MKDRVSTYPGRVRMTPVSGQTNVYTMERADQPSQAGTPINKDTLLKDATAALFGLTSSAVPDDVFAEIAANRAKVAYGSYAGTGQYGSSHPVTLVLPFEPKFIVVLSGSSNYFGPQSGSSGYYSSWFMATRGVSKVYVGYAGYTEVNLTWSGNNVSWYTSSASPGSQCDASGVTYYWIAVGTA